jgi:hypothetical protein
MNGQQMFGIQVVLSFVAYGLMIRWYVSPRLATLPLERTLQPLLVLHTFRHLGLVFLVPTVVGHALPPASRCPRPMEISWRRFSPWLRWRRYALGLTTRAACLSETVTDETGSEPIPG